MDVPPVGEKSGLARAVEVGGSAGSPPASILEELDDAAKGALPREIAKE
jgi:hypothetical protein